MKDKLFEKRSIAAKKAAETRKANALKAKRVEAAKKAVETRRRNAEEKRIQERLEDYRQRGFKAAETKRRNLELKRQKNSERAKKAWVTIRANKEVANK
jgi:hypothetical protein